MAKQTPEGVVKKGLIQMLQSFGDNCFFYMPVQNGMGQSGIPDVMAIIHGYPFAFECKATSKKNPTVLQAIALERIHNALGIAWVVDIDNIKLVGELLCKFSQSIANGEYPKEELRNTAELYSLYRWKHKLEPWEFE